VYNERLRWVQVAVCRLHYVTPLVKTSQLKCMHLPSKQLVVLCRAVWVQGCVGPLPPVKL
jgi:hypothetical protein